MAKFKFIDEEIELDWENMQELGKNIRPKKKLKIERKMRWR